jgi:tRNA pseudouridine32 synthase/23S rRNA pseudouridine746 synthase/23S rRNA pseudouridine955/2504/2580 synthase
VISVLLRTDSLLAVDKPAGTIVIPGRGQGQEHSLKEDLEKQLGQRLWVVHRLDRDTSGVLLFALQPATHRALSIAFELGKIQKIYIAIVQGQLSTPLDLDWSLVADRRGRMRTAREKELGKAARTRVQPIETFSDATLIEAEPLSGRTHQIRVHLAQAGYPLLVDPQYGRPAATVNSIIERTPLHALRLKWIGLEGVANAEVAAPVPEDIDRCVRALRRATISSS